MIAIAMFLAPVWSAARPAVLSKWHLVLTVRASFPSVRRDDLTSGSVLSCLLVMGAILLAQGTSARRLAPDLPH